MPVISVRLPKKPELRNFISPDGAAYAFPEGFADLADAAGAGLAVLTLVGLEGGGCWLGRENLLLR